MAGWALPVSSSCLTILVVEHASQPFLADDSAPAISDGHQSRDHLPMIGDSGRRVNVPGTATLPVVTIVLQRRSFDSDTPTSRSARIARRRQSAYGHSLSVTCRTWVS